MRLKGFIGPAYTLRSVNADCQRCVNLYPEINETQTARPGEVGALIGTPGLRTLAEIGTGPIRAIYKTTNGRLIVVSGNGVYRVSSTWTSLLLGNLTSHSGRVGIADNGGDVVIVDGPKGYVLSGDTLTPRNPEGFGGATNIVFQDGYFIGNQPGTQNFWISALYATSVDGLDYAAAEGSPDLLITLLVSNRNLWLFGETSTEVFFNSGNGDFPFERVQGAYIEHGCAAKFSPAKLDNTVFWLGKNEYGQGTVWAAKGYQPQRISTHAIEFAIQGYSDISDATAYTYQQDGHGFYVLNFPTGGATWVYDTATNLWHERCWLGNNRSQLTSNGLRGRHRVDCHGFANNTHIGGDWENGSIYAMELDYYTDAGTPIYRNRTSPHLVSGLKRVVYHSLQLDYEAGTGTDGTNQGNDPQLMLTWSDDGGHTWSNEHWVTAGQVGKYKSRAIWRRLGHARDRVFSVTMTDAAKIAILGAELDATPGAT